MSDAGQISVRDLKQRMDEGEEWQVLDVRSFSEYVRGHIDGSINMDVGSLIAQLHVINRDRPVAVICQSGGRSSLGCRLLSHKGYDNVYNVLGGMGAWVRSGFPIA